MTKDQKAQVLKAKGRLLWRLINNTPGVADLASHLEKETPFDKLPREEQLTALVIVSHYEQGANGIEEEAKKRYAETATEAAIIETTAVETPAETAGLETETIEEAT
jgi:hypothetical protein